MHAPLRRIAVAATVAALALTGLAAAPAHAAAASLTGTVVAPAGVTLTQLDVCAYKAPRDYRALGSSLDCTDVASTGRFTLGLAAGTDVIVAVQNSITANPAVARWFAGDTAIAMRATAFSSDAGDIGTLSTVVSGSLSVHVTDRQLGTLSLLKGSGEPMTTKAIPSNGIVLFDHLYPGQYRFSASRIGDFALTTRTTPSTVTAGTTTTTSFSRARGAAATGTVTDGRGAAVGFVPVLLHSSDGTTLKGHTNSRGGYAFRGLNSGTYQIVFNDGLDDGDLLLRRNVRTVTLKSGITTVTSPVLGAAGAAIITVPSTAGRSLEIVESSTGRGTTVTPRYRQTLVGHLGAGNWSLLDQTTISRATTVGKRWFTVTAGQYTDLTPATVRSSGSVVTGAAPTDPAALHYTAEVLVSSATVSWRQYFREEGVASWASIEDGQFTTAKPLPDGYYDIGVYDFDGTWTWGTRRILVKGGTVTTDLSDMRHTDQTGDQTTPMALDGAVVVGKPIAPYFVVNYAQTDGTFHWRFRDGVSSSTYYVKSAGLPTDIPAYFTTSPAKFTRGGTLTITGIAGGQ